MYPPFHLAVYLDSIEDKARKWLKQELERRSEGQKFDDYFSRLSASDKLSLIQEEQLALLRLAIKIKSHKTRPGLSEIWLKNHVALFAGLPVVNDETKPWHYKYFSHRLKKLLKQPAADLRKQYNSLRNYGKKIQTDKSALFRQLRAPVSIRKYFDLIALSIWIRLVSRNTFALSHYASRGLFKQIGKRLNMAAEEVKWLTPVEVKTALLLNKFPRTKQIAARKATCVLLFKNGRAIMLEGAKAQKFMNNELGREVVPGKVGAITGMVAYPGTVKGKVKIILAQKDINKMNNGNILVARMTTPEIIPAVKKAAAIVTDEGGITCHAAIISRELGIPCVVGTKIATKILKDDDTVIVYADQGLVKRN
jgi:phosphoenolpyruvate synthase/pyruvate phosphate dikinase